MSAGLVGAPPVDGVSLPHPYTVDSLTVGERKTIEDAGGDPDLFVGVRVPLAQFQPDYEQQAAMAIVPFNREILARPKILTSSPMPIAVGPSHLRILLPRARLGSSVVLPEPGPRWYRAEVEVNDVMKLVPSWLSGQEADNAGHRASFWLGTAPDLEGRVVVRSEAAWMSEAEGWARGYDLAQRLTASAFEVVSVRVTSEPR